MPQFLNLTQAFEWFLENVYPELPAEDKYALRNAKYYFYKEGGKVSSKRMNTILDKYSKFKVIYEVEK